MTATATSRAATPKAVRLPVLFILPVSFRVSDLKVLYSLGDLPPSDAISSLNTAIKALQ
jgi:hypothetical protein